MSFRFPPVLALALPALLAAHPATANCDLTFSDNVIDYGQLDMSHVGNDRAGVPVALASRTLSAVCKAPSVMTVTLQGPPNTPQAFKLGEAAEYGFQITQALLDGKPVQIGKPAVIGLPPSAATMPLALGPGEHVTPLMDGVPARGSRLDLTLQIQAYRGKDTSLVQQTTLSSESQFVLNAQ